ncbi:hypothetical protein G6F65_018590 [Rhizopus arrhizus]|nr:hypothetical protein G6F65_018590 [Rhizopus arrhizus]
MRLGFEHGGVAGVGRPVVGQRIDQADVGDELARRRRRGGGATAGIAVVEPADASAAYKRQRLDGFDAPRAVEAFLADIVAAARVIAASRGDAVDVLPRAMVIDVEHIAAGLPGARETVGRGQLGIAGAHHHFLLHAQRGEVAVDRHVQPALLALEVHAEIAVVQPASVRQDRADRALVHGGVLLVHGDTRQPESPRVVEAVGHVGIEDGLVVLRPVPRGPGKRRARQIDVTARLLMPMPTVVFSVTS